MSGGRLSLKPGDPLPPPTAEQVLSRLAGDIAPVPRSQLKKGVEPHDWRWFVGGLGRVLISLGLLIFAFVGYQLWGTGLQYRQHQNELEAEFAELKASISLAPPPSVDVVPAGPDESVPDVSTAPGVEPEGSPEPEPVEPSEPARPTWEQLDIQLGKAISFLQIPSLDLETVLVAGVRTEDLKKGVGHFPDTPLPGQSGNAALAGHRTTHGAPFGNLDRLAAGDRVILDTPQGHFEYIVQGNKIVPPSDYSVVTNVPDQNLLTLVTCHPKYTARERLVVTAVLDEAASDPVAAPEINYGKDAAALGSPGDGLADEEPSADGQADAGVDVTLAAEPPAADSLPLEDPLPTEPTIAGSIGEPASNDQTEDSAGGALDAGDGEDGEVAGATAASVDAFAAGWFSDPNAWPQVALWGLACTAVSLLAWLLGRKTRNWFSALVGIGPFVIVLYFFFENVNRLLPPNL